MGTKLKQLGIYGY